MQSIRILKKNKKNLNKKYFSEHGLKRFFFDKYFFLIELNIKILEVLRKNENFAAIKILKFISKKFNTKKKKNSLSRYFFPAEFLANRKIISKNKMTKIERNETKRIGFFFQRKNEKKVIFLPYKYIFCFIVFPNKGKIFKFKFFKKKKKNLILNVINLLKGGKFKKKKKKISYKIFLGQKFTKLLRIFIKIMLKLFKKLKSKKKFSHFFFGIFFLNLKEKNFFGLFLFLLKNKKLISLTNFLNFFIFGIDLLFKFSFPNIFSLLGRLYSNIFFFKKFFSKNLFTNKKKKKISNKFNFIKKKKSII
jgi:hypothetical protein